MKDATSSATKSARRIPDRGEDCALRLGGKEVRMTHSTSPHANPLHGASITIYLGSIIQVRAIFSGVSCKIQSVLNVKFEARNVPVPERKKVDAPSRMQPVLRRSRYAASSIE